MCFFYYFIDFETQTQKNILTPLNQVKMDHLTYNFRGVWDNVMFLLWFHQGYGYVLVWYISYKTLKSIRVSASPIAVNLKTFVYLVNPWSRCPPSSISRRSDAVTSYSTIFSFWKFSLGTSNRKIHEKEIKKSFYVSHKHDPNKESRLKWEEFEE